LSPFRLRWTLRRPWFSRPTDVETRPRHVRVERFCGTGVRSVHMGNQRTQISIWRKGENQSISMPSTVLRMGVAIDFRFGTPDSLEMSISTVNLFTGIPSIILRRAVRELGRFVHRNFAQSAIEQPNHASIVISLILGFQVRIYWCIEFNLTFCAISLLRIP
jgi:hypothetical protein